MEKIWQRLWQKQSNERNYLKEIEQKIEAFRVMDMDKQFKNFKNFANLIENNLVEGDFDSRVHIKYLMRFIKIVKVRFFLPKTDPKDHERLTVVYMPVVKQVGDFINELHGVERIKEDRFLNILNHEERVNLDNTLKFVTVAFRVIITQLNKGNFDSKAHDHLSASAVKNFVSFGSHAKYIIGEAQYKIAEQDKINKLKIDSKIFKGRAKKYRINSSVFLALTVALAGSVFYIVFFENILNYDIILPPEDDIDSSAFYIYLILEIVFRGRLLFSVIALTGFFYCLRFYAANQHNAIICEQRANTLEFFEGLYENVEEDKERLLVVEKVLKSATEHLPTGFSKQQSDSGGGGIDPSKLLSLFKGK